MARPEKVAVVDEIRSKLAEADATVLTEYRGLTVKEIAALRGALRPTGTEYKVFKNTLARRAVEEAGVDGVSGLLEGPVALAFVRGDAAAAAKALREFAKSNPALVVKGGLLGERFVGPADIEALADLPPREALLAQIAGAFQAPLVKAAGLFQAMPRNMAYGVKALIDLRIAAGEAAPGADETPAAETPAAETPAAEASAEAAPAEPAPAEEAPEAPADEQAPESTESE
jgi:large subunit ribosomal protein L10